MKTTPATIAAKLDDVYTKLNAGDQTCMVEVMAVILSFGPFLAAACRELEARRNRSTTAGQFLMDSRKATDAALSRINGEGK